MVTVRWAAFVLFVSCMTAVVLSGGVRNGVWLLAGIAAMVFVWSVGGFSRELWGNPTCADCLDGRHLACEGCDCPVDHSIEAYMAIIDEEEAA